MKSYTITPLLFRKFRKQKVLCTHIFTQHRVSISMNYLYSKTGHILGYNSFKNVSFRSDMKYVAFQLKAHRKIGLIINIPMTFGEGSNRIGKFIVVQTADY